VDTGIITASKFLKEHCGRGLQLCYAGVAAKDPKYLEFYKRASKKGDRVILDHSPKVPRSPAKEEVMVEMIGRIRPKYTVLPNYDFGRDKTIRAGRDFLEEYPYLRGETQFVGMLQGISVADIRECYRGLAGLCEVVGLSASMEKVSKRDTVIERLGIKEPVILFEIYRDPVGEVPLRVNNVIGIATSWPVRLGVELKYLGEKTATPRPLDFKMRDPGNVSQHLIKVNISEFRKLVEVEG